MEDKERNQKPLKTSENQNILQRQDLNPVFSMYKGLSKMTNPKYFTDAVKTGKLDVSSRTEDPKFITISLNDETKINKFSYSAMDEAVLNSAVSLYLAGNRLITLVQITKLVYNPKGRVTKKQLDTVRQIIKKLSQTFISCDWTNEARERELELDGEKVTEFYYEGAILPCSKITVKTANGKETEGYYIYDISIFYSHDYQMKQFSQIPIKTFNHVSDKVNMNENSVIIRDYLFKRIARMKHEQKNTNNKILFNSILEQLTDAQTISRRQKTRIRQTISEILDALTESKYIKGYSKSQKGNEGYFIQI